jgi:hypothetical protein
MRAAPSPLFKTTARIIARRTAGAGGASTWAAPSQLLQLAHSTASRTVAAGATKRRVAPRQLKPAARLTASLMEETGGASTWAAPRQLLEAARCIARRMEAASVASRRAAPSQSLELQAARSAHYVCGAHSRSPTVRTRSNPPDTTRRTQRRWLVEDFASTSSSLKQGLGCCQAVMLHAQLTYPFKTTI